MRTVQCGNRAGAIPPLQAAYLSQPRPRFFSSFFARSFQGILPELRGELRGHNTNFPQLRGHNYGDTIQLSVLPVSTCQPTDEAPQSGGFAVAAALGMRSRRASFSRKFAHPFATSENTHDEFVNAEICIESFPVKPETRTQHFQIGEIFIACAGKTLSHVRRKDESAAIGQFNDNPSCRCFVASRFCPWFVLQRSNTGFSCRHPLGIQIVNGLHEFASMPRKECPSAVNSHACLASRLVMKYGRHEPLYSSILGFQLSH